MTTPLETELAQIKAAHARLDNPGSTWSHERVAHELDIAHQHRARLIEIVGVLMKESERLQSGISEAYQVVGKLSDLAGVFDDPQTMKALDWLADPTESDCDVLPYNPMQEDGK